MKETGLLRPDSFPPNSSVTHIPRATFNPEILIKICLASEARNRERVKREVGGRKGDNLIFLI